MPFGRLSPVDETFSESEDESPHSSRTTSTDLRPRSLNFSRPSPQDYPSSRNIHRDIQYATSTSSSSSIAGGSTRGIGAFYEAAPLKTHALPDEPRFSSDDDYPEDGHSVTASSRSNNSDLVWDPDTGELRSRRLVSTRHGSDFETQRFAPPKGPNRSYPPRNDSTSTTKSDQPLIAELPGDVPAPHIVILQQRQRRQQEEKEKERQQQYESEYHPSKEDHYRTSEDSLPGVPDKTPRIIKRTSLSQRSERLSISSVDNLSLDRMGTLSLSNSSSRTGGRWNDSASHHTVKPSTPSMAPSVAPSDSGRSSSLTSSDWKSSEYDISGLSDKKLAKLKKKGINPQLYMEMKAARGGKSKLVGPLVGNTYIG